MAQNSFYHNSVHKITFIFHDFSKETNFRSIEKLSNLELISLIK